MDSLLEEAGFEPSVPLAMAGDHHHSCLPIPERRRRFAVIPLPRLKAGECATPEGLDGS